MTNTPKGVVGISVVIYIANSLGKVSIPACFKIMGFFPNNQSAPEFLPRYIFLNPAHYSRYKFDFVMKVLLKLWPNIEISSTISKISSVGDFPFPSFNISRAIHLETGK